MTREIKTCEVAGSVAPLSPQHLHISGIPRQGTFGGYAESVKDEDAKFHQQHPNRLNKRGASPGKLWGHLKPKIMKIQNWQCVYYQERLVKNLSQIDHITPISRGGIDAPENLQLLCTQCNREKHAKTHEEHLRWRRKVG